MQNIADNVYNITNFDFSGGIIYPYSFQANISISGLYSVDLISFNITIIDYDIPIS